MKIIDILCQSAVSVSLKARNKEEMLSELADLLVSSGKIKKTERTDVLKRIKEREIMGSTGIGKGVAIPHAKCPKMKDMVAAFGVCREGIDFKSLDGEPTYIFFMLIAPGETPGPHLMALAKISKLLDDKFVRDRLRHSSTAQEAYKIIKDEEQKSR
ncbi:MAG: PTS sugar transporter subunit IIA [Candidatus Omnitrophica bacterium]|jgi:PTS system nitrogen regulatory IIA component|nr:PTS sugar transporter subunit IIA [Candidatus Omnitrophota bacterium]MDD4012895.1 PTS sugar transporter subunit IIA [Candidatus Omnitrophota bacterium]